MNKSSCVAAVLIFSSSFFINNVLADTISDCYFQAKFLERTVIAYQGHYMGTGQIYQEAITAFRGNPSENEKSWAKRIISLVYNNPENQFVNSTAVADEYMGNCLMYPEKYLIKR
ncbi:hypothetical protein [Pseudomonas asplenii]|uniref:hypothetical protein n=1 Tax=Pseudomonas asplenii TaxID=53407 RepID=UPI00128EA13F|nr:hypothetical protein [Pseudomonas fuscovaginae]